MSEKTDLAILEFAAKDIVNVDREVYLPMIDKISNILPSMQETTLNFCKSQSQFMDNMMTVSHPTPIRNLRQILAEVEQATMALRESHFKVKKNILEIEDLNEEIAILQNSDKREDKKVLRYKLVELQEKESGLDVNKRYVEGAIRRVANHAEQYQNILNALGVNSFDEIDFEAEEERYHIMTAFSQGLMAARSHGGFIDEGNQIYLFQVGINGGVAQSYVTQYLNNERELIAVGNQKLMEAQEKLSLGEELTQEEMQIPYPDHTMILAFLNEMAERFKGCSAKFASLKGMTVNSDYALIKNDTCIERRQSLLSDSSKQ